MAKFADLPSELLIEIWSYMLQPKDIENFASVSKLIRTLSGKILLEHRKLTRQFSSFEIGAPNSRASAAGLLKEILTNPRVALYTKNVSVTMSHWRWESEEEGVNTLMAFDPEAGEDGRHYRHTPYAEEDMELFMQAMGRAEQFFDFKRPVTACQCLTGAAFRISAFKHDIEDGDDFPIIVLLLLLLTNLKSIMFDADVPVVKILRYISEGQGIDILKRQIEVRILNVFSKYGEVGEGYFREEVFRHLSSVRTIHNDLTGKMVPKDRLSFNLRIWSSNVDGTLAIK